MISGEKKRSAEHFLILVLREGIAGLPDLA